MDFRVDDSQLELLLAKLCDKPKPRFDTDAALKTAQLILLVLAALWAFWLNIKFDFADKALGSRLTALDVQNSELQAKLQQAAYEKEQEEKLARARQVLAESDHDFTYKAVESLGGRRYKWAGTFKLKLTNNTTNEIKVRYSVFDVFVGTVDSQFLHNGEAILVNPPPSAFTYISGEHRRPRTKVEPILWTRTLSIGSTILTAEQLQRDVLAGNFFAALNCDQLKTSDQLLVGNLRPGESSYVAVDFAFNAELGDYIGACFVYGMDDKFSEKEHRHFIPFFELTKE